jgi:hypothetical protein
LPERAVQRQTGIFAAAPGTKAIAAVERLEVSRLIYFKSDL